MDEAKKEKRLTKLVGEVVVRSMSKYKSQMDHETFKKYAREVSFRSVAAPSKAEILQCTMTLVEKEKRGHSYTSARHPTLSDDKKAKIKQFTKDFAHKLLKRLKEKGKLRRVESKQSLSTPSSRKRDADSSQPSSRETPGQNGFSTPSMTPSRGSAVDTPDKESAEDDGGLVDDIFGQDEPDDDVDDGDDGALFENTAPVKSNGTGHYATETAGPNAHLPVFEGETGMEIDHVSSQMPNGNGTTAINGTDLNKSGEAEAPESDTIEVDS